jgi:prepilin-type processing-associated H-X9-DG protein
MKYITPEAHYEERREVHPSQRQIHVEPVSAPLYVVTGIFNPNRYQSRYRLYQGFEKHCIDSGAIPFTVELALRDRHHEITRYDNPQHVQLRGESELWFKENLQNVGTTRLPADWEYVAYVDSDFLFTRPDWATETVHMLQHYDAVQMFTHMTYETYDHRSHGTLNGFAFRRSAIEKLGGLLDCCILGSADWHMSFALAMRDDVHPDMNLSKAPEYVAAIRRWQERATLLRANIGYVDGHVIHHWHGPMKNRGYTWRSSILTENVFNPLTDLKYDWQGVLQLTKNKPKLRDEICAYFRQRSEDSIDI